MNATFIDFVTAQREILAQKSEFANVSIPKESKVFKLSSVTSVYGHIMLNQFFVIDVKHVLRICRYMKLQGPRDLIEYIHTIKVKYLQLNELILVWLETPAGMLAFLRTRYDSKTPAEFFPVGSDYQSSLQSMISRGLHADITALAFVTVPFGGSHFKTMNRSYMLLKHVKGLVDLLTAANRDMSDYCQRGPGWIVFNSKLLCRRMKPVMLKATLTTSGNRPGVRRLDIVTNPVFEPLYLSPWLDHTELSNSKAVVDKVASKHLQKFKFREFIPVPNERHVRNLIHLADAALQQTTLINGLVVPTVYKGSASVALRLYSESSGTFFCVGDYPKDGKYNIRTLMSPEIVNLNYRTITSLYQIEELSSDAIYRGTE